MYEGVVTRRSALAVMRADQFQSLVTARRLRPAFRGVYVERRPGALRPETVRRAALAYADGPVPREPADRAFLCCESASREHDLPVPDTGVVTVSVPRSRSVRGQVGLVVHRHRCDEEDLRSKDGVRVAAIELALVQTFGRLSRDDRRQLVIRSIQSHRVAAARVRPRIAGTTPGRRELLELLQLAEAGSHSELEIKAVTGVMRRFGLGHVFVQQFAGPLARHTPMDFAAVELRVDVETDGSRYHGPSAQRTADVRRDLDLSAARWAVVRCLYEHVVDEPERVAAAIIGSLVEHGWKGRPSTRDGLAVYARLMARP